MDFKMNLPQIPIGLLHTMYRINAEGGYDTDSGGLWKPAGEQRTEFKGVVLPISDKDLQYAPGGTFTKNSEKIYTNGFELEVGASVYDPQSDITYTVKQELGHNSIHPMKRYVVESKGRGGIKRA